MIVAVADTHAVIWYLVADSRLSATAKGFMETAAYEGEVIGVSSITLVEMVYLVEKGRIPAEHFSNLAGELVNPDSLFVEIPVDLQISRAVSCVNSNQVPDMPDRIIAATAVHHNVPVISRDGRIKLSTVKTIW